MAAVISILIHSLYFLFMYDKIKINQYWYLLYFFFFLFRILTVPTLLLCDFAWSFNKSYISNNEFMVTDGVDLILTPFFLTHL